MSASVSGTPPPPGFSVQTSGFALSVSVEGLLFSYSLTEEDLRKVFSRYGRLQTVELLPPSRQSAIVAFVHQQDAELAVRDLNMKVLTGVHGRLLVAWANHSQIPPTTPTPPPPQPVTITQSSHPTLPSLVPLNFGISALDSPQLPEMYPGSVSPPFLTNQGASGIAGGGGGGGGAGYGSSPDFPQLHPSSGEVRKYTARFEIGIENEKEFQVARRLIGVKGQHMKHINKETEAKLRLRGKGSGYLEGVTKQESPEPLHLCVSCGSQEGYRRAVTMVSELLESIYEDYRKFCKNKNLQVPTSEQLHVTMRELPLVAFAGKTTGGDSPSLVPHDF